MRVRHAHGARNRLTTATSATSGTANFSTGLIHAVGDKPEVCHTAISLSRCRRVSTIMMEINKVSDSTTPNEPSVAKPTMAKMASWYGSRAATGLRYLAALRRRLAGEA